MNQKRTNLQNGVLFQVCAVNSVLNLVQTKQSAQCSRSDRSCDFLSLDLCLFQLYTFENYEKYRRLIISWNSRTYRIVWAAELSKALLRIRISNFECDRRASRQLVHHVLVVPSNYSISSVKQKQKNRLEKSKCCTGYSGKTPL